MPAFWEDTSLKDDDIIQPWHRYLYCKSCMEELQVGNACIMSFNLVQSYSLETVTDKLCSSTPVPQQNSNTAETD